MIIEMIEENKKATAFILILALLVGIFVIPTYGADGADKTDLLMGKNANPSYIWEVTVKQGSTPIYPDPTGPVIKYDQDIRVELKFGVPVIGDWGTDPNVNENDPDTYVRFGDFAKLPLSKGFKLTSSGGPYELTHKDTTTNTTVKIGTMRIISEGTGSDTKLFALIDFDGAAEVFDGTGGWLDVEVDFRADLKYTGQGQGTEDKNVDVEILEKTYKVKVDKIPAAYSGAKSGTVDGEAVSGGSILWNVEVRNFNSSSQAITFGAVEFYDNLTNVGEYVAGSFMIGSSPSALVQVDPIYNTTTKALTYDLSSHGGIQYIQFNTKIPATKYYSGSGSTITNTAYIKEDNTNKVTMTDTVSFDFGWIRKTGAVAEFTEGSSTGSIKWVITANDLGLSLTNVRITDILPAGLKFESATLSAFSVDTGFWVSPQAISPDSGLTPAGAVYDIGNISTPIQLTILTSVTDSSIGHNFKYFTNEATISWGDGSGGSGNGDGDPGDGSSGTVGPVYSTVGIGVNPIRKSAGQYDLVNHEVPWTVTVTKSDVSVNLYAMDLFVYGGTLTAADVHSLAINEKTPSINSGDGVFSYVSEGSIKSHMAGSNPNLTRNFNQKYKAGSFQAASGSNLSYIVYTIKNSDGNAVADLLVVAGNAGTTIDTNNNRTFSFRTIVTDPKIYAANSLKTISNRVSLFSANNFVNRDSASVTYNGRMLVKDMMLRGDFNSDTITATAIGAASGDSGFNYIDHTVVFRLHVNANELKDLTNDITTVDGATVGAVTLTDTLPAGWEFVPIVSGGAMFYIYEGTPSTSSKGKVVASGSAISPASFVVSTLSPGATTAAFTFNELNKPYVIFVRAKLTDDKADEIFSKNLPTNNGVTFTNRAELSSENDYLVKATDLNYSVKNTVLGKSKQAFGGANKGIVKWTIDYKPNVIGAEKTTVTAIDTLPIGLDLRTDSNGNLLVTNGGLLLINSGKNLEINQLILKSDGTYGLGPAEDVQTYIDSGKLSFDVTNRVLTWVISDTAIAYRFSYITDVTGDPGTVHNTVKLVSEWTSQGGVTSSHNVDDEDVKASMKRGGWLELEKINGTSGPAVKLDEVIFNLWSEDGFDLLRTGTTNSEGKVSFRGLPVNSAGEFYLLEEMNFESLGFKPLVRVYEVQVIASGGGIETAIYEGGLNGGEKGPNEITLYNYKSDSVGNVKVAKALFGQLAEREKEFEFTISSAKARGPFAYNLSTVSGGAVVTVTTGFAIFNSSGDYTFNLKGNQTLEFIDVPFDIYTIVEDDYSASDYVTYVDSVPTDTAIVVINSGTTSAGVIFENSRAGWIEITKTDADDTSLTLTGAGFTLYKSDGAYVASGLTGPNGKIRFNNIDLGEYYFQETTPPALYGQQFELQGTGNIKHYVEVVSAGGIFTLINGTTGNAISLINYIDSSVGDLLITKLLSGNNTSSTKEFTFTIEIPSMAGVTVTAIGGGGKANELVYFSDSSTTIPGIATITLKGKQSLRLIYLLAGSSYKVSEDDYSKDGYKTTVTGEPEGNITTDAIKVVTFTNHKSRASAPKVGSLTISKTVVGPGADKDREFMFQFRFPGDKTSSFAYVGVGVPNGTIKHGEVFGLKHGQSITINNLPAGGQYAIAEGDYSACGYLASAEGAAGTIVKDQIVTAKFVNSCWDDDSGEKGKDPDDDTKILGEEDEFDDPKDPDDPTDIMGAGDKKIPKTGDGFLLAYWIYLFLVSILGMYVLQRRYKRKYKNVTKYQ